MARTWEETLGAVVGLAAVAVGVHFWLRSQPTPVVTTTRPAGLDLSNLPLVHRNPNVNLEA